MENMKPLTCQKCKAQIHVDQSLLDRSVQDAIQDLLTRPLTPDAEGSSSSSTPKDAAWTGSFIVLPQTLENAQGGAAGGGLSAAAALAGRLERLLDAASGAAGEIDHPLCGECAGRVERQLLEHRSVLEREAKAYRLALAELQADPPSGNVTDAEIADLEAAAAAQESEERALRDALARALDDVRSLERELDDTQTLEDEFWQRYNEAARDAFAFRQQADALEQRRQDAEAQLQTLQHAHVLHDAFRIGRAGAFGTINGLRLGRVGDGAPPQRETASWAETNAALGHVVLLVDVLAGYLGHKPAHCRLVPMGSFSKIELCAPGDGDCPSKVEACDLFRAADLRGLVLPLWRQRFDRGLRGLCACIGELGGAAERADAGFSLPHRIDGLEGLVGGYSVRLHASGDSLGHDEARWTVAMRLLLEDCKYLIAAVRPLR